MATRRDFRTRRDFFASMGTAFEHGNGQNSRLVVADEDHKCCEIYLLFRFHVSKKEIFWRLKNSCESDAFCLALWLINHYQSLFALLYLSSLLSAFLILILKTSLQIISFSWSQKRNISEHLWALGDTESFPTTRGAPIATKHGKNTLMISAHKYV